MENSELTQKTLQERMQETLKKNLGPLIIFVIAFILIVVAFWQFSVDKSEKRPIDTTELQIETPIINQVEEVPEVIIEALDLPDGELTTEEVLTPTLDAPLKEEVVITLPPINESDVWIESKLPELSWRSELLSLLMTEDIIRRFVVFTDNFSQGLLAYDHSVFIQPQSKFSIDEQNLSVDSKANVWQWDNKTSKRFDLYVDLLRSVDSSTLVNLYIEAKPLIDEAYSELGYEEDFTFTLQDAITRVLDMELPKSSMNITRSSVMYKYEDPKLEALSDSDKLLLRIGKENLLIIKSVLIEINEKLNKRLDKNG